MAFGGLFIVKKLSPRFVWLSFFVLINLICGIVIWTTRSLLGETSDLTLDNVRIVPWLTLLVVGSYLVVLVFCFNLFVKFRVKKTFFSNRNVGDVVGVFLLILQLAFIGFFLVTGTFVAGSSNRSESAWSAFWVLVSVDSLMLIYYGFYRSSTLFIPNILISIVSNLLRGWNGIFVIIIFMESCRLMREGKLKFSHVLLGTACIAIGSPFLLLAKWQVREFFSSGFGGTSVLDLVTAISSNLDASSYFVILKDSFFQIFERLHLVSNVIAVYQNSQQFALDVHRGTIAPFWMEGLHGLAYGRITGVVVPNLGTALAQTIAPWQEIAWNSNPGYVGWFFVTPWLTPLYLLYTGLLAYLSVYLVKKIRTDKTVLDMLWFAWCVFLVPGWLASFVLFVHSLAVFYLLHVVAAFLVRVKVFGRSRELVAGPI